jgi:hypothetical protein
MSTEQVDKLELAPLFFGGPSRLLVYLHPVLMVEYDL